MDKQQKEILDRQLKLKRGAAIIEGTQEQFRQDGYSNLLNKYGTKQDNSMAYQYNGELITDDMELIRLYEGNGLFAKIINRPSEEAVKHGLDIDYGDEDIEEYVDDRMDNLEIEDKFATAEKWARLYGGSIIVMLVNDGRGLEEPLDWKNVQSIEELRVFERAIVQPDYSSMYNFNFKDTLEKNCPFGEPEYYQVFSIYGYFTVHRSRCLVFRNGRLPEQTTNAIYRYWGIPEYVKIKRALRECITSHEDGVKLLERSVQAIYKMKNLANMLGNDDGENKVLQRLQVIDMARGILNSIAIDTDGEDYDFKSLPMTGVKDVIDATCNMLSAVTDIPQTILFGRSPAGMNSTGDSDFENYYNMVENIQKQNMKANARTVIDLILRQGKLEGKITEIPKYKMKFAALWSLSESEQASVEQTKAATELTKAQTAQIYMEANVLDPSEVRNSLASEGAFEIEEVLSDEDLDLPDDTFDLQPTSMSGTTEAKGRLIEEGTMIDIVGTDIDKKKDENTVSEVIDIVGIDSNIVGANDKVIIKEKDDKITSNDDKIVIKGVNVESKDDGGVYPAAAVIIIHNGKILCARRSNNEGICGPGGKVEAGETTEEAAIREAKEEFNIIPLNLIPLGEYKGSSGRYLSSKLYFTDEYKGTPKADGEEMLDEQWLSLEELQNQKLFSPFKYSLEQLEEILSVKTLTTEKSTGIVTVKKDGGPGSGNFGHEGVKGQVGGSAPSSGGSAGAKANSSSSSNKFETNAQTHRRLCSDDADNCGVVVNYKIYTVNDAIKKAEKDIKFKEQLAGELSGKRLPMDKQKAGKELVENGEADKIIKKYLDDGTDYVKQKWDKKYSEYQEKDFDGIKEQSFSNYSEGEKIVMEQTGGRAMSMKEYYDTVGDRSSITTEEYQLEQYYVEGGQVNSSLIAERMNKKMYSGKEEQLNYSEKRFNEMVKTNATELAEGTCLYRASGISYLERLTGVKSTDESFKNEVASLVGKETTFDACTSCAPGIPSTFGGMRNDVCIRLVATKGAKMYAVKSNIEEGEFIAPPGTKAKIISVSEPGKDFIPVWRNRGGTGGYGDYNGGSNSIVVEVEVSNDD